jgi:hypothetical protein
MRAPDYHRFPAEKVLKPWRPAGSGRHVLVAYPGPAFGVMLGLDMQAWSDTITERVRQHTDLPLLFREKKCERPLVDDLADARCVVTHSSNVAVDAIVEGVPAIVEKWNPAAPVCSGDLADIERPPTPDRRQWWASLMCQQYTLAEMASGLAWHYMQRVMAEVDG